MNGGTRIRRFVAGLFVTLDDVVESPAKWQPRTSTRSWARRSSARQGKAWKAGDA
jgi:hypothetical protein